MNQELKPINDSLTYKARKGIRFYAFLLFCLIIIKALFFWKGAILPDEAYYWLWSKNIDLSYYDHPPLASWFQGLLSFTMTNKYLEVRIIPTFCFAIIFFLNMHWVNQLKEHSTDVLQSWKSSVLFCSIPLYGIFLTISFPDAVMILFIYLSAYYFFKFLHSHSQNESQFVFWYIAVIFFSLSCLGKYNGVFYGLGILLFLLWNKKLRRVLLPLHLCAAFSIFLFCQLPIIVWNINNSFVSLNFHLNTRLEFDLSLKSFIFNALIFLIGVVLAISPLIFFKVLNCKSIKLKTINKMFYLRSCYWVLTTTLIICVFLNIFTNVLYYWAIVAFIMFIPLLSIIIEKKSHIFYQAIYGFFFLSLLYVNSSIYPLALFFGSVDRETAILYGWDEVTNKVQANKRKYSVDKVVFMDYRLASLYSFHADDFETDAIMAGRDTQFDIWRIEKNIKPKQVLIIEDYKFPIHEKIRNVFSKIIFLEEFPVVKGNNTINIYKIYLAYV